jgi:hypothetical protein
METVQVCLECGATWQNGQTCQDAFHQMLYWEHENPSYGEVHHLMVLCYHLQHPSLYSPEGLHGAMHLLAGFVAHGVSTAEVRRRSAALNSRVRTWKIKGTPASHGVYATVPHWTIRAGDIIASGVENYCESVRAWAQSVYEALNASGNFSVGHDWVRLP